MCGQCREQHESALDLLAVQRVPECTVCQKSLEAIAAEQGTPNPRMVAQFKDGIYQLLCHECSDRYEQQRRDLYGETPYGQLKGIA